MSATVKRRPAETVSMHSRACLTRALGSSLLWRLWVRRLEELNYSPSGCWSLLCQCLHWRRPYWFSLLIVLLRNAVDEHGTPRCPGSLKTQVRGHLYDTPDFERVAELLHCTEVWILHGIYSFTAIAEREIPRNVQKNCVTSVWIITQSSNRLSGRRPAISPTKTSSLSLPTVSVQGEDLRSPRRKHHLCRCRPFPLRGSVIPGGFPLTSASFFVRLCRVDRLTTLFRGTGEHMTNELMSLVPSTKAQVVVPPE